MRTRISVAWRVVLVVLVLLVCLRLSLPYLVARHITSVLSTGEYEARINDVDIALFKGQYTIDSVKIFRSDNTEIPVLQMPAIEVGMEWQAVLSGEFVSDINLISPTLTLIDNHTLDSAATIFSRLSKLSWVPVNRFRVQHGVLARLSPDDNSSVNLLLQNIQMDALNLVNAAGKEEELPSRIYLQALSVGNGQLNVAVKMNAEPVPDMDIDLRLEKVDVKALALALKDRIETLEGGTVNIYAEVSAKNGEINGYIKPIVEDLDLLPNRKTTLENPSMYWSSIVDILQLAFKQRRSNQQITSVKIEGRLDDERRVFPSLWNTFSNAVLTVTEASSTSVASIKVPAEDSPISESEVIERKSKKEIRKEKRKERRERKKNRREKKQS